MIESQYLLLHIYVSMKYNIPSSRMISLHYRRSHFLTCMFADPSRQANIWWGTQIAPVHCLQHSLGTWWQGMEPNEEVIDMDKLSQKNQIYSLLNITTSDGVQTLWYSALTARLSDGRGLDLSTVYGRRWICTAWITAYAGRISWEVQDLNLRPPNLLFSGSGRGDGGQSRQRLILSSKVGFPLADHLLIV